MSTFFTECRHIGARLDLLGLACTVIPEDKSGPSCRVVALERWSRYGTREILELKLQDLLKSREREEFRSTLNFLVFTIGDQVHVHSCGSAVVGR